MPSDQQLLERPPTGAKPVATDADTVQAELKDLPQRDIVVPPLPRLSWEGPQTAKSLDTLYRQAEGQAIRSIAWYLQRARRHGTWARALRAGAVVLTSLGGLAPLIATQSETINMVGAELKVAHGGYIMLALAATLLAADRYTGYSTGFIRYISTGLRLQRLLIELQLDWARLSATLAEGNAAAVTTAIDRLKTFLDGMFKEIEDETTAWATEFQSASTQLERYARDQAKGVTPGRIQVRIANRDQIQGTVQILLDGVPVARTNDAECELPNIPPGRRGVSITGTLGDKPATGEAIVIVPPSGTVTATVTLAATA